MSKTQTHATVEQIAALEDERDILTGQRNAAHEQLKALDHDLPALRAAAVRKPAEDIQQALEGAEKARYDQQNAVQRLDAALESIKADLDTARARLVIDQHAALEKQVASTLAMMGAACDELDRNWEDSAALDQLAGLIKQYNTQHRAYVQGLTDGQVSKFPKIARLDIAFQNRIAHLAHELFKHTDFGIGGMLNQFRGRQYQPAATFRAALRIEENNNGE